MLKRTCGVGFTAATSFNSASAPAQSPPVCRASACANCSRARLSPSPSLLGPCAQAVTGATHTPHNDPSTKPEPTSQRLSDLSCIQRFREVTGTEPQHRSVLPVSLPHKRLNFLGGNRAFGALLPSRGVLAVRAWPAVRICPAQSPV